VGSFPGKGRGRTERKVEEKKVENEKKIVTESGIKFKK